MKAELIGITLVFLLLIFDPFGWFKVVSEEELKLERKEKEEKERQKWTNTIEWNDVLHKQTVTKAIAEIESLVSQFNVDQYKQDENGYRGQYNQYNEPHGVGRIDLKQNSFHIGQFHNGRRHGLGKSQSEEGDIYVGEYRFDLQHGKGKLFASNGDVYEGDWRVGEQDGFGTYRTSNGVEYSGTWQKGVQHGRGVYRDKEIIYDGEWENGKRHGWAKLVNRVNNTVIFKGKFENDTPVYR